MAKLFEAIKYDDIRDIEEKLADFIGSTEDGAISWSNNPLLQACKLGSIKCALEIVRLKPEFAKAKGAMHYICEFGDTTIVERLVELFPELCKQRHGPHDLTPLHVAAIRGDERVLSAILTHCPDSVGKVTSQNEETALHLALKHDHYGCFQVLIAHVQNLGNFREILNHKDHEGNTALHIATSGKQIQVIKLLLSDENPAIASVVDVNALNRKGLTALDLHYQQPYYRTNNNRGFNSDDIVVANNMTLKMILETVLLIIKPIVLLNLPLVLFVCALLLHACL